MTTAEVGSALEKPRTIAMTFQSRPGWLRAIVFLFGLAAAGPVLAANMTPIGVTGFNRDVIVENSASGPPYTGAALNFNSGENNAFYQTNLAGKTHGLPLSGVFTNAADGSTVLQLQPYTAANGLDLSSS